MMANAPLSIRRPIFVTDFCKMHARVALEQGERRSSIGVASCMPHRPEDSYSRHLFGKDVLIGLREIDFQSRLGCSFREVSTPPKFKEVLPGNCPPKGATTFQEQVVIRIVTKEKVNDEDFLSHSALGVPCPEAVSLCVCSACSLWSGSQAVSNIIGFSFLPKLKEKFKLTHLAHLTIDQNSGVGSVNRRNGHISFWMFDSFDPVAAVVKCEPLP